MEGHSNALPCPVTLTGNPGHQDGKVVLPTSLDRDPQRPVLSPGQLHRPQAGLHVVGVLVLPDVELLPLEGYVVRAELDPAGLWSTLAIADTDQSVVELSEESLPGSLDGVGLRHVEVM